MLKKLTASLGIGSTTVDTLLNDEMPYQGETLKGVIKIKGGIAEQKIDAIVLKLCTEVKVESDSGIRYHPFILNHIKVNKPFLIEAGQIIEIPFELPLHDESPVTVVNAKRNQCRVWLETSLDIDFALDPRDRDFIHIKPLPIVERIIHTLEQEGFNLVKADVEKGYLQAHNFKSKSGCYQELEFQNSRFFNRKEIELSFILAGNNIHCLVEVDRTLGRKDTYHAFTLARTASQAEIDQALALAIRA